MTFDQLSNLLETTKSQIRALDNKAQVLLGVNGVLVGFITAEVSKAAEYGANGLPKRLLTICIMLGLAFLASCASMAFALFVIHPQLAAETTAKTRFPANSLFFPVPSFLARLENGESASKDGTSGPGGGPKSRQIPCRFPC